MPTPSRLSYGCIGFAALTLVAAASLLTRSRQDFLDTHTQDAVHREIRTALTQAREIHSQISVAIGPSLQSLSHATSVFISTNATTARLQFEGMAHSLRIPISW